MSDYRLCRTRCRLRRRSRHLVHTRHTAKTRQVHHPTATTHRPLWQNHRMVLHQRSASVCHLPRRQMERHQLGHPQMRSKDDRTLLLVDTGTRTLRMQKVSHILLMEDLPRMHRIRCIIKARSTRRKRTLTICRKDKHPGTQTHNIRTSSSGNHSRIVQQ